MTSTNVNNPYYKALCAHTNTQAAFFLEERDIMAWTTSPWLTSLHYAFQVSRILTVYISCMIVTKKANFVKTAPTTVF